LQGEWHKLGIVSQVLTLTAEEGRRLDLGDGLLGRRVGGLGTSAAPAIVLHYSGYGYAQRGLCAWLVTALRRLRQGRQGLLGPARVVVVFHELFANGPPWRSAFWLGGLQAGIARELQGLADASWTTTSAHAQWLLANGAAAPNLQVAPVFSNIPEASISTIWAQRDPTLVVFGAAATRRRALQALQRGGLAQRLFRDLGVQALIEVGDGDSGAWRAPGLPHRVVGRLAADEVGALLQASRWGLIAYPRHLLAKSSVFAAYAVQGCLPINLDASGHDADGLCQGREYVGWPLGAGLRAKVGTAPRPVAPDGPAMTAGLHRWYQPHRLQHQAQSLAKMALPGFDASRGLL